ncbi:MAG: GNAT family N-acetyltransferase [Alphaproteobacteria bacterium]|nr:GNAT family N-acetyltransferase [Alphaproteobacteria bacterium]
MKTIKISSDNLELLDEASFLFNEYRKFYNQKSDIKKSTSFLRDRINNNESEIFLCFDEQNQAIGFMQLYKSFSSVGLRKIYILNDLYVDEKHRGKGVGRFLIDEANKFAAKNQITKITLTTAKTNKVAQNLYETEGYVRDNEYFVYNLEIKI